MDPKEITKLAESLRESGDKVLAGDFKLCLSGAILRALNDCFTLIAETADLTSPQSFQVVKPNISKSGVFRDLQLIHDFVQKTILLCISKFIDDDEFEGKIDIAKFRSLRRLEVHKVNIKQIVGIQPLRAQLQHLICNRSIDSVADIITYCGGDDSNGFAWNELKTANFSYNNLKTVDSSLEFAQWLQHLTLSYNQLSSVAAIKWLPHLKVLDLRYNRLTTIPNFHTEASRRLQVLIISNNFIEDLGGISRLEALTELDLSNNCLLDHVSLLPLSTLISLRYLNLQGNPLACHPKHRRAATSYLHKNTASVKFVLDTEPLSKTEKTNVGRYPNYQSVLTMRLIGDTRSSGLSTPIRKSQTGTPTSSIGSEKSIKLNNAEANEMTISTTEKQKKVKVRSVEIEEHKTEQDDCNNAASETNLNKSIHLEISTDHLETKKQIEDLRNKYGEGWLKNKNAHVVQSVLGLDTLVGSDEHISQKILLNDFLNDIEIPQADNNESSTYTEATMLTSTPINKKDNETFNFSSDIIVTDNKQEETSEPSLYSTAPTLIDEITSSDCQQSEFDSVSDPEENEMAYIVTEVANSNQHFLTISDTYIKEKNILTRKTKTKWSLKFLESCERIKSDTLRINFDTIKKDKKQRVYIVEEGLCENLDNFLKGILSKRQLSEMNQILYRCITCSCQFSRERVTSYRENPVIFCPECKKTFVVEVYESPKTVSPPRLLTQTNAQSPINPSNPEPIVAPEEIQRAERQEPEKSASHSSIANDKGTWRLSAHKNISSAGSLNESSSCSKISNSESSFDSNQSIAGSSTNDRDQDFNFSKNYESDVEVLSNPSQSSIEVLDHGHPSRKTSEERKISRIPSLETIQDQSVQNTPGSVMNRETSTETSQNEPPIKDLMVEGISKKVSLGPINLTESSSSGSVTDSICTTYEQGDKDTPVTLDAQKNITQSEKDNKKDESIISSMFGGLFQSTNLLMSRSQKPLGTEPTCEPFKFNYRDFSDGDHRLKFYFYQKKFEDNDEHFKWLVKGKIFNENTYQIYEGIIVMSTKKFYVMEIIGPENEAIQKWLKQIFSGTVNRIESVQLLPWKIGMSFKIKGWDKFSLILQDISRTDSLLLFFANNPLPDICRIDYQPSEKIRAKLSSYVKEVQLKMFSILNKCEISSENTEQVFSTAAFFTTETHLYLTSTNLSWLSDSSDADIESGLMQFMSNIVDVVTPAKNVFTINFLDDIQNKYELWTCTFETDENADSCLNAIGQSWEKLFGVPFFVSN